MSTILNALRKAKQDPPKETVDARREILSERTHDYLATVPSDPEGKLRVMRILMILAGAVILVLAVWVIVLLVSPRGRTEQKPPLAATSHAPTPASMPVSSSPRETPVPQVSRLEIVVSTPAQPAPVSAPTPTPASPPSSETPVLRADEPAEIVKSPKPAPAVQETSASLEESARSSSFRRVSALRLNGIVWDSKSPMAMIDGQTVREGSRISGALVKKINRDSVVILLDGETFTLRP